MQHNLAAQAGYRAGQEYTVDIKEDHAEVTLGILIKIPPNLLLDLSPITFGKIKMFSKVHLPLPPEHGFRSAGRVHQPSPP